MPVVRLKADLVRRVVLRAEPGVVEERHATWLELFFDLAFVACVGVLGTLLAQKPTWAGFSSFAVLFVPVWWGWVGHTYYLSRFDADDLVHRVAGLIQIGLVVGLAVSAPAAFEGSPAAFALVFAGLRAVLLVLYGIAYAHVPRARPLVRRLLAGFSLAMLLWVASAFVPDPFLAGCVWAVALVIDLVTPFTCPELQRQVPPDFGHIPERFGLFTIIVLGETIIAAVAGASGGPIEGRHIALIALGLGIAFSFWWVYFEGVRGAQANPQRPSLGLRKNLTWLFAHLPLAMGVVVTAVGLKKVLAMAPGEVMGSEKALLVGGGVFMALVALHAIFFSGLEPGKGRSLWTVTAAHAAATLLVVPVALFGGGLEAVPFYGLLAVPGLVHVVLTWRDLSGLMPEG